MSDDAFSALVDEKLAAHNTTDAKTVSASLTDPRQPAPGTEAPEASLNSSSNPTSGPSRMKPVQGGEPPRLADGGPEGTSPSTKTPSGPGKPDDFSKHIDAIVGKASNAAETNTAAADADAQTGPPQPAPTDYNGQIAFNAPSNAPPLSVSASGVGKALGDTSSSSKASTSNRGPGTTSPTSAALIKTSAVDPTGVATDLSEAVQAIAGRARSDGDADPDGDADSSAKSSTDLQLGAASQDAPPTTLQPDGAIAAPLNPTPGTSGVRPAEAPSRTVTNLSAQIIGKLGDQSTRFDVALDPAGLGRVNVSVEINAKGEMSARLSFEHPEAAAALSRESGALRQALHDAGFQMKPEDLTFQSDGGFSDRGAASQWDDGGRPSGRANPFGAMNMLADAADLSAMNASAGRAAAGGLDIRI